MKDKILKKYYNYKISDEVSEFITLLYNTILTFCSCLLQKWIQRLSKRDWKLCMNWEENREEKTFY